MSKTPAIIQEKHCLVLYNVYIHSGHIICHTWCSCTCITEEPKIIATNLSFHCSHGNTKLLKIIGTVPWNLESIKLGGTADGALME